MEFKLFRCKHCGNVVYKLVDSGVPVICCGEAMAELVPNTTDGAVEKHVPAVTHEGDTTVITIGSVPHPMLPEHFIPIIAAVAGDTVTFRQPKPGDAPVLKLKTDAAVKAYEFCNIHGFWTVK